MSPREHHITWLASGREGYGIERCITTLALEVQRRGTKVSLLCCDDGPLAEKGRSLGLRTVVLWMGSAPSFGGGMLRKFGQVLQARQYYARLIPELMYHLHEDRATVLHVVNPALVNAAAIAADRASCRCFWEMPNLVGDRYPFGLNRRLYQWTISRHGVQVLANSKFTAATIRGRGVEPIVVYPGTDEYLFSPDSVHSISRAELGIPDSAAVFGMVARFTEAKGQHQLLESLKLLGSCHPELHVLLIGGPLDTSYGQLLRRLADDSGFADRVHLIGHVPNPQAFYGAIDVAVSIRSDPEPFGLSVVEASMMERPVLVHALGGPSETVIDSETGWHIRSADSRAVRDGIARALASRDAWGSMGKAARSFAVSNFSVKVQADQYLRLL